MFGVYAHVPWCRARCPYCAFAVDLAPTPDNEGWVAGVLRDWGRERQHFRGDPATLALGGGTPSRADPASLARVIDALGPTGEVTMEANPEDVSAAALREWRTSGVTRLSLGVQSFSARTARRLGRGHGTEDSGNAVRAALDAGFRSVSLDLMFAVEGQSADDFAEDLDRVESLGVDHVSLYGLTIEAGTPFARRGQHTLDDDAWREMYDVGVRRLSAAGLLRYEVSNFARPGRRSQHNEHYWRARPWAGLGPAAHGWRPTGERVANAASFGAWRDGRAPAIERPEGSAFLGELLWSTLRHVDGVDVEHVRALTGRRVRCPDALLREGLLVADARRIALTDKGFPLADALAQRLRRSTEELADRDGNADRAYL